MALSGRICLVTGASKGIGRGIALQLGSAGATVYITGRSVDKLKECADEIQKRGGKAIPVAVDHSNDSDVEKLFERIKNENNGRLDVLVNNAYAGVDMITRNSGKDFFIEDPAKQWDCINGVGLRNHFLCTVFSSRLMMPRKDGLIVNVSSAGGIKYLHNVCYGVGKAAVDRMAADCGFELKDHNVTMVSLWPGPVKTEFIQENVIGKDHGAHNENKMKSVFETMGETIEFSGKAIAALAADPNKIQKTGKIVFTNALALEYGFRDEGGILPIDFRSINFLLA